MIHYWYLIGSVICFFVMQGVAFAYFQRRFPRIAPEEVKLDAVGSIMWSAFASLMWPTMLIAIFFLSERFKYGFIPIWRWSKQPGWNK